MDRKLHPPRIIVSNWEDGPGAIPKRKPLQPSTEHVLQFHNTRSGVDSTEEDFISVDAPPTQEQNETTMTDLTAEKCPEGSSLSVQTKFNLNFPQWSAEETPQFQKSASFPNTSGIGFDYGMPVTDFTGKIRRKKSRLHCRRKAVAYLQSPLGHDIQGEKRLRQAVQQGNLEEVQDILQEGINPNRADEKGRAALHFGVTKGHRQIVQVLLDGGSDVNQKDGFGNTPLHLACVGSHVEMVTVLLEAGANCHELDRSGHTPIHLAKSRLNHLRGSLSEETRQEVFRLLGMLRVYMACTGRREHISELDSISEKLQVQHSQKEIDEVQNILESFTKMNL